MPHITAYGGIGQIGGNKILIEDQDARVFLDMGQTFHLLDDYFVDPWLMPRKRFGLKDYLSLGLMPRIPGLYAEDQLGGSGLAYEPPAFDGIFISHCHFDHIFHLQFVDPKIPVYLGETAKIIIDAWEATSSRINLGEREYRTFRTGDTIRVHGLDVEPVHVDHSVPGAYGFVVHTSDGAVVYTGDLRRHGPHGEMTDDFLAAAVEARPSALVTEGTRMAPKETRKDFSEEEVRRKSTDVIANAGDRLVTATFYPRDIDRMRTMYLAATESDREFITSSRTAYLLRALERDTGLHFPRVFRDYGAKAYFRDLKTRPKWETRLRDELGDRAVDAAYVRDHEGETVLQVDFAHMTELVDVDPTPGGEFIHSKSEPFEEDALEDRVLRQWLRRFGLRHRQLHASGHMSRSELETMVREVNARQVIPVHTEHPDLFVGLAGKVTLPRPGQPMPV
ncbi:MAG: MBL fold metallo-hydrolase [Thermoplasmata archaeon]